MYRSVILALIVLTATSTSLVAFFDFPKLSYGEVGSVREVVLPTEVRSVRTSILFTGDLMLARRVETLMDRYGSSFPYERLPHTATSTEYVVTNFEASAPQKHVHTPDLTFRFSVDRTHLAALSAYGVTHASLANNHSYDAGLAGYRASGEALAAAHVVPFGDQVVGSSTVAVLELEAATVAVFALYAVDKTPDLRQLAALMASYATTTYQVAYIHWGSEYREQHLASTEALAHELVSLGFDAIIGHHPHVVQDIGLISGVPVFYSLGNFVFDQYFSAAVQEGMMVRMAVDGGGLRFELLPHTSADAHSQPRMMHETERAAFLRALAVKSDPRLQEQIMAGMLTFLSPQVANSLQSSSIAP
jgi:poly-gamma-glutamate capsule biosynthesis protein CapA/YwtB (metallophosphatase superfamily)